MSLSPEFLPSSSRLNEIASAAHRFATSVRKWHPDHAGPEGVISFPHVGEETGLRVVLENLFRLDLALYPEPSLRNPERLSDPEKRYIETQNWGAEVDIAIQCITENTFDLITRWKVESFALFNSIGSKIDERPAIPDSPVFEGSISRKLGQGDCVWVIHSPSVEWICMIYGFICRLGETPGFFFQWPDGRVTDFAWDCPIEARVLEAMEWAAFEIKNAIIEVIGTRTQPEPRSQNCEVSAPGTANASSNGTTPDALSGPVDGCAETEWIVGSKRKLNQLLGKSQNYSGLLADLQRKGELIFEKRGDREFAMRMTDSDLHESLRRKMMVSQWGKKRRKQT